MVGGNEMRRSPFMAIAFALAISVAPASLGASQVRAAGGCAVQYVIAPYLDGDGNVETSTNVVCDADSLTLYVEIELLRWTGSSWVIAAERTVSCNQCHRLANFTEKFCSTSTSTQYYARARYRWPDSNWPWSGWSLSTTTTRPCR